jgi:membrane-anchored protein YejM (alkaline phosphatase superfamily)
MSSQPVFDSNRKKSILSNKIVCKCLTFLKKGFTSKERLDLFRWSAGYFTCSALLFIILGIQYLTVYTFPHDIFSIIYIIAAFVSHFSSIALIIGLAVVLPIMLIFPYRKIVVPLNVIIVSLIVCVELLDAQVYTAHRFHFNLLTVQILGWKTWSFGIIYLFIAFTFNSFVSKIVWTRFVDKKKRLYSLLSVSIVVVLLLYTHIVHAWADAVGYVQITQFTTSMPLFYPSTAKNFMIKHGFAKITDRRSIPKNFTNSSGNFHYPLNPLQFPSATTSKNILIIGVDAMRSDMMSFERAPNCMRYARQYGNVFTNHWSGGNSTRMGLFSLFYGISPTYQQYIESNKRSPVLMDELQNKNYSIGIFTSYRLYSPADLDISAFVKIPNLRMETKIPGDPLPYRTDSAITVEWKEWLNNRPQQKPFFGFLFYDAVCGKNYPPSYQALAPFSNGESAQQHEFKRYTIGMHYVDSLIGNVLDDLKRRSLLDSTIVIITSDHGEEFNENKLGYTGHGSSFSDFQVHIPLIVLWPGKDTGTISKRTSHYDIVPTLMKNAFGCLNQEMDYSSGNDLYSLSQWNWLIVGSYFNFAIVEPDQMTVQFPGGYFEVRDRNYQIIQKPQLSSNLKSALGEIGRFYKK